MCWSLLLFCITLQQLSCSMHGAGFCEKNSGRLWVCCSKVFNGLDYHQHTDMMNPGKKICRLDHYPDTMMIQVSKTCSITRPSISQTTTSLVMMSPTCLHKVKLSLPPPFVTHCQGFHTVCWYGIHFIGLSTVATSFGLVSTFEHTRLVRVWVFFFLSFFPAWQVLVLGTFKKLS
jgi:hypothetical protein